MRSQRAVPAMIMQPMFPLGDLNVATWTTFAADDVVEVAVDVVTVLEFVLVASSCSTRSS